MTHMRGHLAVATALALAGAAMGHMFLVARINLDSRFGAAGSDPIEVVSDGTYVGLAGMNNTPAETPNPYGWYDSHCVAATNRLRVLEFLNRKLPVFGATPVVQPCPGDLDCSGTVNFDDIDRFVEALSDPGGAGWPHPECPWSNGDCNADGNVNFDDIDPFVARIGATCP